MKVLMDSRVSDNPRLVVVMDDEAMPGELGARDAQHGWEVGPATGGGWLRAFDVGQGKIDDRDELLS